VIVFNWPADGKLLVPGLKRQVTAARLLAEPGKSFSFTRKGIDVIVSVPGSAPDPVASVVALQVAAPLDIEPLLPGQAADGSLRVPAPDAICHGEQVKYEGGHHRDNIGFWRRPADWVEWQFTITRPGKFAISVKFGDPLQPIDRFPAGAVTPLVLDRPGHPLQVAGAEAHDEPDVNVGPKT
jgi:alpha-L-fucosidase